LNQLFNWNEQTWLILDQTGILAGDTLMSLSIVVAIAGWIKKDAIRRWFSLNRFPEVGGSFDDDETDWDGLVFTVSQADVPEWVMQRCKPEMIALIATQQSQHVAEKLEAISKELGIHVESTHIITDPDDPQQSRRAVSAALDAMKKSGLKHLAVDVTGGKTPMSLGAFMAAEEACVDTMYVSSSFDSTLKKPDMRSATIRRISESG